MSRPTTRLVIALTMLFPLVLGGQVAAMPSGGALPPVLIRQIDVADRFGIPADAEMVAANVTAVGPAEAGHITVYPCDEDVPATSNINYVAGDVAPNLTLTRISAWGSICVSTFALTDVIVDVVGYVPAGSGITALPNPVRFLDSRTNSPAPIRAGTVTEIPTAGRSGVDADAEVALFNLTAIGAGQPGHLTTFPCGEPLPDTSSVNYGPTQVVPNLITSRIGSAGSVCVFNLAPAEIIVDVAAFATSGLTTLPNPVRILDTRVLGGVIGAGGTMQLDITARPDVPDTATAAIYNLTAVDPLSPGFATSYPCDIDLPLVSNLNYAEGQVAANGTITKLADTGALCIYSLAQTDLVVDLIGYTEGDTDYVPLDPIRIWDSRESWQRTCDWLIADRSGSQQDSIAVLHGITGEVRHLPLGFTTSAAFTPTMNADCSAVVVLIGHDIYELAIGGGRQRTPVSDLIEFGFGISAHDVGGGILYADESGALFDIVTGDRVWGGARPAEPLRSFDVSPNGIAALTHDLIDRPGPARRVEIWDVLAARLLYGADLDGAGDVSMSPNGTYFAVGVENSVMVSTLFGDVVSVIGAPVGVEPHFAGTGELFLCADFNGIFTWELYGPTTQRLTWSDLERSLGRATCGLSQ